MPSQGSGDQLSLASSVLEDAVALHTAESRTEDVVHALHTLAEPGTNLAEHTALVVVLTVATLASWFVAHLRVTKIRLTFVAILRTELARSELGLCARTSPTLTRHLPPPRDSRSCCPRTRNWRSNPLGTYRNSRRHRRNKPRRRNSTAYCSPSSSRSSHLVTPRRSDRSRS
jgi:hypothetical protein